MAIRNLRRFAFPHQSKITEPSGRLRFWFHICRFQSRKKNQAHFSRPCNFAKFETRVMHNWRKPEPKFEKRRTLAAQIWSSSFKIEELAISHFGPACA